MDNDLTNPTDNVYPNATPNPNDRPNPSEPGVTFGQKRVIKPTHANRAWHTLREASYGQERVDKTKNHLPNTAPLRRINTKSSRS
ncbi:MAG: hypothetical protein KME16_10270 [Scytolyngbya sp. HA4215-MV1]|nr:hypothetical protein [Scytolyngbya sp. HA4215-MV1]